MQRTEKDDVLKAAPEAWPLPREVAGVKLPDSKLARDATDYVRGLSAPVVFNHVLRREAEALLTTRPAKSNEPASATLPRN